MITAVQDRLDLTLDETKTYLKVSNDLDNAFISDLITIAKQQADQYLQNEFVTTNETGDQVLQPIPVSIRLACLKMIASWYETRLDDRSSENIGGYSYQLGEIPWSSLKLLHPFKRLVGL